MQHILRPSLSQKMSQFYALTKPRVTQLAVFCAVIGMFLATPELPPLKTVLAATIGIWLLAGAAFAINCLVEREIDSRMARTARRPMPQGDLSVSETLTFAGIIGALGMLVLVQLVNPLTMWLTFGTFLGYAVIYTILLKPATSQNIVIGGAAGAMPPALGWAAIADHVPAQAWLLVLIIFLWTPPHFWALALMTNTDYARANVPMLPNVRGVAQTKIEIFVYSVLLVLASLALTPLGVFGLWYFVPAFGLGAFFMWDAWKLLRGGPVKPAARALFKYSLLYLALMCVAMVLDSVIR
jgi:protoheme IX farnesyltransferase